MADVYEVKSSFTWKGDRLRPGDRISADELGRSAPHKVESFRRLGLIAEPARARSSKKKQPESGPRHEEQPMTETHNDEGASDGV